jgi:hypothetical protein
VRHPSPGSEPSPTPEPVPNSNAGVITAAEASSLSRPKSGDVGAMVMAAVAGLAVGAATSALQTILPAEAGPLANSGAPMPAALYAAYMLLG